MKVRISYGVDIDDDFRRALNHRFGRDGLATREEVKSWFKANGTEATDDLMYDYDQAMDAQMEESA